MKNPAKINIHFLALFIMLGTAAYAVIYKSPVSGPTGMAAHDSASQQKDLDPYGGVVCRSKPEEISMGPPVIASCRGKEDIDELLLAKGIVGENGDVLDNELLSNELFTIGKSIYFELYDDENIKCNYKSCMLKCRDNSFEFPSINLAGLNKDHQIAVYYTHYDETENLKPTIQFKTGNWYTISSGISGWREISTIKLVGINNIKLIQMHNPETLKVMIGDEELLFSTKLKEDNSEYDPYIILKAHDGGIYDLETTNSPNHPSLSLNGIYIKEEDSYFTVKKKSRNEMEFHGSASIISEGREFRFEDAPYTIKTDNNKIKEIIFRYVVSLREKDADYFKIEESFFDGDKRMHLYLVNSLPAIDQLPASNEYLFYFIDEDNYLFRGEFETEDVVNYDESDIMSIEGDKITLYNFKEDYGSYEDIPLFEMDVPVDVEIKGIRSYDSAMKIEIYKEGNTIRPFYYSNAPFLSLDPEKEKESLIITPRREVNIFYSGEHGKSPELLVSLNRDNAIPLLLSTPGKFLNSGSEIRIGDKIDSTVTVDNGKMPALQIYLDIGFTDVLMDYIPSLAELIGSIPYEKSLLKLKGDWLIQLPTNELDRLLSGTTEDSLNGEKIAEIGDELSYNIPFKVTFKLDLSFTLKVIRHTPGISGLIDEYVSLMKKRVIERKSNEAYKYGAFRDELFETIALVPVPPFKIELERFGDGTYQLSLYDGDNNLLKSIYPPKEFVDDTIKEVLSIGAMQNYRTRTTKAFVEYELGHR